MELILVILLSIIATPIAILSLYSEYKLWRNDGKTDKDLENWVKSAIEASEDFDETGALCGKNPKYTLEELLAQTTPEAVEYSRKVCHEWNMSKAVGNECYWEDDEGGG